MSNTQQNRKKTTNAKRSNNRQGRAIERSR